MEIKLNVYENNQSSEPMQTYVCYGFSFETILKFEDFQKKSQGTEFKEQMELIIDFIKSVFPDFNDEHLYKLRPNDLHDFMLAIGQSIKGGFGKAEKN